MQYMNGNMDAFYALTPHSHSLVCCHDSSFAAVYGCLALYSADSCQDLDVLLLLETLRRNLAESTFLLSFRSSQLWVQQIQPATVTGTFGYAIGMPVWLTIGTKVFQALALSMGVLWRLLGWPTCILQGFMGKHGDSWMRTTSSQLCSVGHCAATGTRNIIISRRVLLKYPE